MVRGGGGGGGGGVQVWFKLMGLGDQGGRKSKVAPESG